MTPRREQIRGLFTRIAGRYDALNRVLTFGIDVSWRRRALGLLAAVARPDAVLDLATGTADFALGAARRFPSARVTGVDLTPAMLEIGRRKVARAKLSARIELLEGDALSLPFAPSSFDAAICAFGFRNFPDIPAALAEAARVLRPQGALLVLELFRGDPSFLARATSLWLRCASPLVAGGARGDYAYLRASIEGTWSADEFLEAAVHAGFRCERKVFFRPSCSCLVLRKYGRIEP